jgi:hypothetical protein
MQLAFLCGVSIVLAGCTATFTESDLAEQERRMDEAARTEEQDNEEIDELGGRNEIDLDAQEVEAIEQSDL